MKEDVVSDSKSSPGTEKNWTEPFSVQFSSGLSEQLQFGFSKFGSVGEPVLTVFFNL